MPLDGSDNASPVPGTNTFTANTTILSALVNALANDIYNILNSVRGISHGATGASTAVGAHDNLSTKGADIAAGATTNLATATGAYVHVTGSGGPITSFGTATAGVVRFVEFDAAPIITHNATSLILPGGADIRAAAGDAGVFISEGGGNWRCLSYVPANGLDLVLKGTDVASAATVTLGAGSFFHITGNTGPITDIDFSAAKDGRWAILEFDSNPTITHNGTTLNLPGAKDIVAAAGDRALIVQDSGDNVHFVFYQRAVIKGTRELVAEIAGTATPNIDFFSLSTRYSSFEIEIDGLGPSVDDDALCLRVQTGGATVQTTGYQYSGAVIGPGGAPGGYGSTSEARTSVIGLAQKGGGSAVAVGNAAGEVYRGKVTFNPFDTNAYRTFNFGPNNWLRPDGATWIGVSGMGSYNSTAAITGVRLFWESGSNFRAIGNARLYGVL